MQQNTRKQTVGRMRCDHSGQRDRRGLSLIEISAVLAIQAVIMTISVGLIYTMFDAHRSLSQRFERDSEIARLSDRFRSDVHACDGPAADERLMVVPPIDNDKLKIPKTVLLRCGDQHVSYCIDTDSNDTIVHRTVQGQRREEGKPELIQRETFRIGRPCTLDMTTDGPIARLTLAITNTHDANTLSVQTEAVIGYDVRHR